MAKIKPFKALRYNKSAINNISDVVCPPYDIIDDKEIDKLLKKSPYNIVNLELPRGNIPYKTAKLLLEEWKKSDILKKDDKDCIYIYEEEFELNGEIKKTKGIICLVELEEFSKNIILPHEKTFFKAKEDRYNLLKETHCNFSSIQSIYVDEDNKTSKRLEKASQKKPSIEIKDDFSVVHRLWVITDKNDIYDFCKDFDDRKLYIADGHHRYETALRFKKETKDLNLNSDYTMMLLTSINDKGLTVLPTHRIIKDVNNFDAANILLKLKQFFEVTENLNLETATHLLLKHYNLGKTAFAVYFGNNKYTFLLLKDEDELQKLNKDKSKSFCNLDVTVLHTVILENILGINNKNSKNQINLDYTRNLHKAISSVDSQKANCAFILNPTKVSQIKQTALLGEKMPQKSTYFYPKPLTGFVINQL